MIAVQLARFILGLMPNDVPGVSVSDSLSLMGSTLTPVLRMMRATGSADEIEPREARNTAANVHVVKTGTRESGGRSKSHKPLLRYDDCFMFLRFLDV